jgi:hypothetical protein
MAGAADGRRRSRSAESFDLLRNAIFMRLRQTKPPASWEYRHARLGKRSWVTLSLYWTWWDQARRHTGISAERPTPVRQRDVKCSAGVCGRSGKVKVPCRSPLTRRCRTRRQTRASPTRRQGRPPSASRPDARRLAIAPAPTSGRFGVELDLAPLGRWGPRSIADSCPPGLRFARALRAGRLRGWRSAVSGAGRARS